MKPDQIGSDLQSHFHKRLNVLMEDTMHTCDIGGMSPESIGAMMLSVLFYELTLACHTMNMSKMDYVKMSILAYEQMSRTIEKHK
jgi:hypothetical protein